jgi:hypothetical protein
MFEQKLGNLKEKLKLKALPVKSCKVWICISILNMLFNHFILSPMHVDIKSLWKIMEMHLLCMHLSVITPG